VSYAFAELVAVMDRLRSPGGCPWDAEQTHLTLAPYAIEEAYELAEAVEADDRAGMREELGDLLLQVVFHARLAQDDADEPFDVDDVAADLTAKLVRRHPHVFADAEATDLHGQWDRIKKDEKQRDSVFDGIPVALGALARAQKVAGRAQRSGLGTTPPDEGLGARLLALVIEAREAGLDAEGELRRTASAWEAQMRATEAGR